MIRMQTITSQSQQSDTSRSSSPNNNNNNNNTERQPSPYPNPHFQQHYDRDSLRHDQQQSMYTEPSVTTIPIAPFSSELNMNRHERSKTRLKERERGGRGRRGRRNNNNNNRRVRSDIYDLHHHQQYNMKNNNNSRRKGGVNIKMDEEERNDTWESVATSWLLPDCAQVIWRVCLTAGLLTTFILSFQNESSTQSLYNFSVYVYLCCLISVCLLLCPCIISALGYFDTRLDGLFAQYCWTSIIICMLFSTSFLCTTISGYVYHHYYYSYHHHQGTSNSVIDKRHFALIVWIGTEWLIGNIRIFFKHVIVACFVFITYLIVVVAFILPDEQEDKTITEWWLESFKHLGNQFGLYGSHAQIVGWMLAIVIFIAFTGIIWIVVEIRIRVAEYVLKQREEEEKEEEILSAEQYQPRQPKPQSHQNSRYMYSSSMAKVRSGSTNKRRNIVDAYNHHNQHVATQGNT